MLSKLQSKKEEGFTIIEVLIVLAIAGLILLIVFLAVPALQRNSRNSTRNNDAARISALVTECMSNRNGVVASCDSSTEIGFNSNDFGEIITLNYSATAPAANATTEASYQFAQACVADGSGATPASAREFVVQFRTETPNGDLVRCIGSE